MAIVPDTWTGNQDDGDPLSGTANMAYLTALRLGVNDIDNSQINANAGIAGTKLADLGVSTAKLANNSVTEGKLLKADTTNGVRVMSTTAPQRKEVWGKTAFTILIATPSIAVPVAFNTGADTPIAFFNNTDLIITCTLETTIVAGDELICDINTIAASGFTVVVRKYTGNVAAQRTGFVHWHAIGRTA